MTSTNRVVRKAFNAKIKGEMMAYNGAIVSRAMMARNSQYEPSEKVKKLKRRLNEYVEGLERKYKSKSWSFWTEKEGAEYNKLQGEFWAQWMSETKNLTTQDRIEASKKLP